MKWVSLGESIVSYLIPFVLTVLADVGVLWRRSTLLMPVSRERLISRSEQASPSSPVTAVIDCAKIQSEKGMRVSPFPVCANGVSMMGVSASATSSSPSTSYCSLRAHGDGRSDAQPAQLCAASARQLPRTAFVDPSLYSLHLRRRGRLHSLLSTISAHCILRSFPGMGYGSYQVNEFCSGSNFL